MDVERPLKLLASKILIYSSIVLFLVKHMLDRLNPIDLGRDVSPHGRERYRISHKQIIRRSGSNACKFYTHVIANTLGVLLVVKV